MHTTFFSSDGKDNESPLMQQMKLSCATWPSGMKIKKQTNKEKASNMYLRIKKLQSIAN